MTTAKVIAKGMSSMPYFILEGESDSSGPRDLNLIGPFDVPQSAFDWANDKITEKLLAADVSRQGLARAIDFMMENDYLEEGNWVIMMLHNHPLQDLEEVVVVNKSDSEDTVGIVKDKSVRSSPGSINFLSELEDLMDRYPEATIEPYLHGEIEIDSAGRRMMKATPELRVFGSEATSSVSFTHLGASRIDRKEEGG